MRRLRSYPRLLAVAPAVLPFSAEVRQAVVDGGPA